MATGSVEKKIDALRDEIRHHEYLYYVKDAPELTDAQLIDAMVANPILIERPIVVTPKGTRLCRPWETVKEIA